jgi:hypothetical protein
VLVGIAVPSVFDSLQLVFILWAIATSGWLLVRGNRASIAAVRPEAVHA